ncbi:unnamed protein product [Polarella glacialis]|nr:unnamed protein product [Polarella glacialis]
MNRGWSRLTGEPPLTGSAWRGVTNANDQTSPLASGAAPSINNNNSSKTNKNNNNNNSNNNELLLTPTLHSQGLRRSASATGGKGLFALTRFQKGEVVFQERAVLDSCSAEDSLFAAFTSEVLQEELDPIWCLVANFVALLDQPGGPTTEALSRRAAVDAFYRPRGSVGSADLPGAEPYEELACHMHSSLREEARSRISLSSLSDLLHIVRLNAHTVRVFGLLETGGTSLESEGLGLFPWLHLTNHSCAPNTLFSATAANNNDKKKNTNNNNNTELLSAQSPRAEMELRAAQAISPGEELHISYLEPHLLRLPAPGRRRVLRRDFGFDCRCERCVAEGG